jgi:hypothetical protein
MQDGLPFGKGQESEENFSEIGVEIGFEMDENVTFEKLLEPSRITVKYENVAKEDGLKTDMVAEVHVEPFEIKVGFRELEFFNKYNKSLQEFL